MADLGRCRPPQSVAEVLGSCLLPVDFVRALSARFRLTGPDGTPLSTDIWKGGGSTRSWAASRLRQPQYVGSQSAHSLGLNGTEKHTSFTRSSPSRSGPTTPANGCLGVAGSSPLRDSPRSPRPQWFPLRHSAPSSSASKPSIPGPTPGVLHLYLRVWNCLI